MNMEFKRKLPIPSEVKTMFPLNGSMKSTINRSRAEIRKVFSGESDKLALIIGPCSADNEEAVVDYMHRLRGVQDKIKDKISH